MKQFNDYWVVEDEEGYGNALVIRTEWKPNYINLVEKYNIKIIRLNECLGWRGSDVSFLKCIPNIQGVGILSDNVTDVSPVFSIDSLRTLSLACDAKVGGDFSAFKNLESVFLVWRKIYETIFDVDTLIRININGYPQADLAKWKPNKRLNHLLIESRVLESLYGIENFQRITRLRLFKCRKLESLDSIRFATTIQSLRIDLCPGLYDLSPISQLVGLKELEIEDCGTISSLAPLAACKQLEELQIAGKTMVEDGNFAPLLKLQKLKRVIIKNQKHYSHNAFNLEKK